MTEAEWNSCTDPEKMLESLHHSGKASDRKLRLFAVACCRRIWPLLNRACDRRAIEVAEQFADGHANDEELAEVCRNAWPRLETYGFWCAPGMPIPAHRVAAASGSRLALETAQEAARYLASQLAGREHDYYQAAQTFRPALGTERLAQADVVRDMFGHPSRAVAFDPAWRIPTVLTLAQRAYEDRHLPAGTLDPVLLTGPSDTLEQAGCADEILAHLRSPGPHMSIRPVNPRR